MRLPNLLETRRRRLAAFFLLYVTEGIPLGFAAVAIATQLRREGVGPAAIGAFVASLYLPWAFKWAFGPIVDVFAWERFGRRRGWILLTQVMMALSLFSAVFVELPEQLALFTAIVIIHNVFGATQDVAIDALACGTLSDDERGTANGLMFAGAYLGQAVGGAGVLFLTDYIDFQVTFVFVALSILAVTTFVVLPMREPPGPARPVVAGPRWRSAMVEIRDFAVLSFRSIVGTRGAFAGLFVALVPIGAMSLGLALGSNLGVELGLTDRQIARLNVAQTVIAALCCVMGGFVSDRVGRRKMIVIGVVLAAIPVLAMAAALHHAGWIMPIDPAEMENPDRPIASSALMLGFFAASVVYSASIGLIYGVRTAMFMDVTNPAVAATQFTAYMALMNVTIAYSATWQGIAAEAWGYPRTLVADVAVGFLCLALIPFMRKAGTTIASPPDAAAPEPPGAPTLIDITDAGAPRRARGLAIVLALALAAWLPWHFTQDRFAAAQPIVSTFFALVLVGSAVFLGAGGAVVRRSAPMLARIALGTSALLLLVAARRFLEPVAVRMAEWLSGASEPALSTLSVTTAFDVSSIAIVALGAVVMSTMAARSWSDVGGRRGHC